MNVDSPHIIDAFLFFNEIDLARFRIEYLKPSVDLVVIGESSITFRGDAKPLYFKNWIETNKIYSDVKVISLDILGATAWQRETSARDILLNFLINNYPKSAYIISDCDEIPSRQQVEMLSRRKGNYHFRTPAYYRKGNYAQADKDWIKPTYISSAQFFPNAGRNTKFPILESPETGCHFSYLNLGQDGMAAKLASFSHAEFDSLENSNQALLDYCDRFLIDHLGRVNTKSFGLLRQLTYEELPAISRDLHAFAPFFFDFQKKNARLIKRLFASSLVSFVTKNGQLKNDAFNLIIGNNLSIVKKIRLLLCSLYSIMLSLAKNMLRS